MAEVNFVRFAKGLEHPAYVAVGFGVLAFQRAQVCRRAWQRRLFSPPAPPAPPPPPAPRRQTVADVASGAAERLGPMVFEVAGMAAERLGPLLSEASERVAPLLSEASERVAPLVTDTAERLGPLMSDAAERLGPLVSETVERLQPEAHEFREAAGELLNDLPGEARQIAREAVAFGRFALQALWAPPRPPATP